MLTSLTMGVLPLILEKRLQAQFLIPMAVSLGFGILFATAILMLLVPALTMLDYKVEQFLRRTLHLDPSESDGLPQQEVSLVAPSTAG